MDRCDHSIELMEPPATVWRFTTDLERTPQWRTTITSIQPPCELRVGERCSGTTRLLGRCHTGALPWNSTHSREGAGMQQTAMIPMERRPVSATNHRRVAETEDRTAA